MERKRNLQNENDLRAKYRWEFLKRNKNFQAALKIKYGSQEFRKKWKEFGLSWDAGDVGLARDALNGSEEAEQTLVMLASGIRESAVSMIVLDKRGFAEAVENEIDFSQMEMLERFRIPESVTDINPKDNSIIVKIKLDKGNDLIFHQIRYLLALLDKERELFDMFPKRPIVKPRWDTFDLYVKVYDLRETTPRPSWSKIAEMIFPKDVSPSGAIRKVRYYYDEAVKMINGGWKNI